MDTLFYVIFLTKILRKRLALRQRKLRNIYVVITLFLRNLRRAYVLITLLYNYVKTPYLTQQTFTCSKLTIETLEKGLTYVQS